MDHRDPPPNEAAPAPSRQTDAHPERGLVVFAFVGLWMALGWLLKLDANQYLLLGVPLTVAFQLLVNRRPLWAIWVRNAPPLRVTWQSLLVTVGLAALPAYGLYRTGFDDGWAVTCWYVCAILGAPAVAYAIQNHDRRVTRSIRPAASIAVFIIALMVVSGVIHKGWGALTVSAALTTIKWSLLYLPISFVVEEVTFRGALDAYVYRPEDKRGMGSAVALSFLWGLWHLPIVPLEGFWLLFALRLGCFHTLVGVPLSMSWRIGGNLLVPAVAHAVLDGVRNAMLEGP